MNKVAFNIFLLFCGFLVVVVGLGLTMIIAPGLDILGLRYIRSTSGSYFERQTVYCAESNVEEFNINCENIPIVIQFVQSYTFSVELDERFNGFTKTVENPDITVEYTNEKTVFLVREYSPVVYHNRLDGSALKISIPIYYAGRVAVQAKTSNVVVQGLNGTLGELIITTNGKVSVNEGSIPKLYLNVGSKSVKINKGALVGDLHINSKNSRITIADEITGKINYIAQGGGLYFNSCNELEVNANSSKISSSGDVPPIVNGDATIKTNANISLDVKGSAKIETKSGKVVLGQESLTYGGNLSIITKGGDVTLLGSRTGETEVTTKSGNITAENLNKFKLESNYGFIEIGLCTNGTITAGSGNVKVLQCLESIELTSRSGDVTLGDSEHNFSASTYVTTLGGNVKYINAMNGDFDISTRSGDISFIGSAKNSSNIKLTTKKGDVYIESFAGKMKAETLGKVSIDVISSTAEINVLAWNKDVTITTQIEELTYNLSTAKADRITILGTEIKEKLYKSNEQANINIFTNKGKINVVNLATSEEKSE